MSSTKGGKAATRGQKQIYDENCAVIRQYTIAAAVTSVFCLLISVFIFERTKWEWFGFLLCFGLQLASILTMRSMANCRRNERGHITDAGSDLNQAESFGEYCKDVVILSSFVVFIATFWSSFLWILLLIPAYVAYKVWTAILAPWFFAEPLMPEEDDKKQKKRERRYRRI